MSDILQQPSPWYVAGPLIGLTVPALLIAGNKTLGISSSLRHFCAACLISSAVVTGMISVWLIKKFNIKTIDGEKIELPVKKFHKGQVYGGLLFGFGWAITAACPGALFAQIGSGFGVIIMTLLSAVAGTWVYGYVRDRLPH